MTKTNVSDEHTEFCSNDIITVFNAAFKVQEQTQLISGDGEPLYVPASNRRPLHCVIFAHGFYRSALHEIAHWCIAGKVRRQLLDYGYWYQPDGRNAAQQKAFEQVEQKPQALELLFCKAVGHPFEVSCDNLAAADPESVDSASFQRQVETQAQYYREHGLPPRAQRFIDALQTFYRQRGCAA